MGRPRSVHVPPCPACETEAHVTPKGLKQVDGETKRSFVCGFCDRVFVPGVRAEPASTELKAAVRRVREETGVPLRLIAAAMTNHLGVHVSHTTVGAWCREAEAQGSHDHDEEAMACEYISILWALRHEIDADRRGPS